MTRLIHNLNPLKLAVFGANVSQGCNVSTAPERVKVEWQESVRIAQASEAAGLDALIPIAHWVGFGGSSNHNDRCYEASTWAAGLAAVTKDISTFATVHVGSVHPVKMAKEAVTIDHISGGRFGINVVVGYVPTEIEMFGLEQLYHDRRYEAAGEWMNIVRRIWTEATFDIEGKYYMIRGAHGEPKPLQRPRPMIMNAGNSKQGSAFVARALIGYSSSIIDDKKVIERIVLTFGGWPVIGMPDQVVDQLRTLSQAGLDGLALSWPDFDDGIARCQRDLLPRLQAIGLRI